MLIHQLAQCEWSRAQDASIALFLLHPEIAPSILDVYRSSSIDDAEQIAVLTLAVLTLAALYMQRLWSVRLLLAFGHSSALPEAPFAPFWQNRNLPSPEASFEGRIGLEALERYEQKRKSWAHYQIDWQNQVDHLLYQEDRKQRRHRGSVILNIQPWETFSVEHLPDRSEHTKWITADVLTRFLSRVADVITTPCAFYLADEAMMVSLGIRPGLCIDFDTTIEDSTCLWEIEAQEHIQLDFILADRYGYPFHLSLDEDACHLETRGLLTVYRMHLPTMVFHKLWHASTCDIRDVFSLVRDGWITLSQLDKVVQNSLASSDIARRATIDERRLLRYRYRKVRSALALMTTV